MRLAYLLASVGVAMVVAPPAHAYPEFQYSSGATRCAECHASPVGGGLLSDYGRDEAGSTIAGRGDGSFLHGLFELPDFIQLGGDFRVASVVRAARGETKAAVFPMQGDLYARAGTGGFTIGGTFGVTAQIREADDVTDRLVSREHTAMYEDEDRTYYLRAGRFMPAWGLRLPDHTQYVRRYTGLHTLEEAYALGGGRVKGQWEMHATLVTPLTLGLMSGARGWGGAVWAERGCESGEAGWGVGVRGLVGEDYTDLWAGGVSKRWWKDLELLALAEGNLGLRLIDERKIGMAAIYGGLYWKPAARWGVRGSIAAWDPDLRLTGQERFALDVGATIFPYAHFELALLGRLEVVGGAAAPLALLQLHYFL